MINEKLLLAIELHKQNKFFEASEVYKFILAENNDNFHALHYLGLLYLQNGFKEGLDLVNKSIELAGNYPEAHHNLRVFHESEEAKFIQEIDSIKTEEEYPIFRDDTVSAWRMKRMLDFIPVFSKNAIDSSWLTIGDAYGHDAAIIKNCGIRSVVPSNIDTNYLSIGAQSGHVGEFLNVNAEKIPLPNSSFDYVLCKEALHHMPRPYMAIYEMLRIAKSAICLIEPMDTLIDHEKPRSSVVTREKYSDLTRNNYITDSIRYKWPDPGSNNYNTYEVFADWYEDGAFNYVYTLSAREIRKICYGMGLPGYAIKPFNDIYDPVIDNEKINDDNLISIKNQIEIQDHFCKASGKPHSYISSILFKNYPNSNLIHELKEIGFIIHQTPTIFMPFKFI